MSMTGSSEQAASESHSRKATTNASSSDARRRQLPSATYRLQLHDKFKFTDAQRIVPYLKRLGISHVYASPFLKARPGSMHGYDIIDHTQFNPEIGTEDEFREFVRELHSHSLGLIVDIVPNHMAVATSDNPWWTDVLEHGPSSPYAGFFDIDWMPLKPDLANKVLLPVLGDQFGTVLENGQFKLALENGIFSLYYFDRRFPITTRSTESILKHRLDMVIQALGSDSPDLIELQSILTAISHLPSRTESDAEKVAEGRRETEVIRRRLKTLCETSTEVNSFLQENIRLFNGTPGDPGSFDLLDQLLLNQAYRLSYWRVAADEINYRRFFDVNELAAICMENPTVFQQSHELIFRLIKAGLIDGLRVDHPDGLYDPLDYFTRLVAAATGQQAPNIAPNDFYLVVEKILGRGEQLPSEWPVHGTTGYDFLNALNGVFVDRAHAPIFETIYSRFIEGQIDFKTLAYRCKKLIMDASMSAEISVLGHRLDRMSEQDRSSRDFTLRSLTEALQEIVACFPVYRTYITDSVPDRDRRYVDLAVARAKRMNPAVSESIFDFVHDTLLLKPNDRATDEMRMSRQSFVSRFQQVTGPIMAKAVEDTAFYIENRLVSLNEVGGDPEKFGLNPAAFHQQNLDRFAHWPSAMLATSTHDTKRSEDVRARINVLSEIPKDWRTRVARWSRVNQKTKIEIDGELVPSRNDEYLLYQTLVGTWPRAPMSASDRRIYIERIQRYMLKASREAKVHTSWVNANATYEEALQQFVAAILNDSGSRGFVSAFEPFAHRIADCGIWNSLSQTMLKLTCPGIPDFYQGTEMCDFSLVDPDNRRPVDFATRDHNLGELEKAFGSSDMASVAIQRLMEGRHEGLLKQFVVWKLLTHRRTHPEIYSSGKYIPINPAGPRQDSVLAFGRVSAAEKLLVVAPRLVTAVLPEGNETQIETWSWDGTELALPSEFASLDLRNIFTGEELNSGDKNLSLTSLLKTLPIAVLHARP